MTGFLDHETSRVRATVYPIGDTARRGDRRRSLDPVSLNESSVGGGPTIVAASTQKVMGMASGKWVLDVKCRDPDFLFAVIDDDWADIVFTRNDLQTHVMRGVVDDVRRVETVDATGTTQTVFRISGSDHGRIFESTPVWYDILSDGNRGPGMAAHIFYSSQFDNPSVTVQKILAGFLRQLPSVGRNTWPIPQTMPGRYGANSAIELMGFYGLDFDDVPARRSQPTFNLLTGDNSSLWDLAMQWSDPLLCELYTELMDVTGRQIFDNSNDLRFPTVYAGAFYPFPTPDPSLTTHIPENDLGPAQDVEYRTTLAPHVIFRDRPFPTRTRMHRLGGGGLRVYDREEMLFEGPYFTRIPTYDIMSAERRVLDVGHNGYARKNAFFLGPEAFEEFARDAAIFGRPLWHPLDMQTHGIRRFDVSTKYTIPGDGLAAQEGGLIGLLDVYRRRLRDFHAFNHFWLTGTIVLTRGRPDIRIGTRVRLKGDDPIGEKDETYYVESVSNVWQMGLPIVTTLGVSHGFVGSDLQHMQALSQVWDEYVLVGPDGNEYQELDPIVESQAKTAIRNTTRPANIPGGQGQGTAP